MALATQSQAVLVAWQVYSLTKDPLSLGLVGLSEVIPAVGFALFAGHFVDLMARKTSAIIALLATGSTSAFLYLVSFERWGFSSHLLIVLIYCAVFISGLARALARPSFFSLLPELVSREKYVRATALNSTVFQIASSAGPAMGGVMYVALGPQKSYFCVSGLIAIAIVLISGIKLPKRRKKTTSNETFLESLTLGVRFVFSQRLILSALSLDLFAVLFGGATALLPIFADLLSVGPRGLGLLRAAPATGAFVMAFYLTHKPPSMRAGKILLSAVAGSGLCMIFFALSKNLYLSLGLLALSGALDSISVVVRTSILQLATPNHMLGRVSAVNGIFISSSNELGAFESGVAAKWMGTIPSVLFGGSMTLLVVAIAGIFSPELRALHLTSETKSRE